MYKTLNKVFDLELKEMFVGPLDHPFMQKIVAGAIEIAKELKFPERALE